MLDTQAAAMSSFYERSKHQQTFPSKKIMISKELCEARNE